MVVTELAVFTFEDNQLALVELMPGATLQEVRAKTEAAFIERLAS
jgi:3-oxoacid CoA-transferase